MPYTSLYGPLIGRGTVEANVLQTLSAWIVAYLAEYERQNSLPPRVLPVPPTPESIHGDLDLTRFSSELFPELLVVVQPVDSIERHESQQYGSWYRVQIGAVVQFEGDQDATRAIADAYGIALQAIVAQQGAFGYIAPTGQFSVAPVEGGEPFATRTRLWEPASVEFPDADVRDVIRATVTGHTFIADIVSDSEGPRVPPMNPYAVPASLPLAKLVEVALIRGTPDTEGLVEADAVIIDGTVNPPVTRFEQIEVDEP